MENEQDHEEEPQPRKIRVVDKRISSRRESTPDGAEKAPPSPPSTPPSEPPEASPRGAGEPEVSSEEPATVTPLRPPPPARSEHPSAGAASSSAAAAESHLESPGPPGQEVWTPEQEEEARRMSEEEARRMSEEMARIPSLEWVINVAVTLANAAGTKLNAGLRDDSGLAIDALAAIIEKVGPQMGEAEAPLRQTLAQLQMAYAQADVKPDGQP